LDEAAFWDTVMAGERQWGNYQDAQLEAVRQRLRLLPPEDILDYQRIFDLKHEEAYRWDLWGAAYLINGGCSDDGFAYVRCWLISRGEAVHTAAVADPDSLADWVDPEDEYEFEEFWYAAHEVYEEKTGKPIPFPAGNAEVAHPVQKEPLGDNWDFEDDNEVRRHLPRLAALYLEE
jgi:hypothetical protein